MLILVRFDYWLTCIFLPICLYKLYIQVFLRRLLDRLIFRLVLLFFLFEVLDGFKIASWFIYLWIITALWLLRVFGGHIMSIYFTQIFSVGIPKHFDWGDSINRSFFVSFYPIDTHFTSSPFAFIIFFSLSFFVSQTFYARFICSWFRLSFKLIVRLWLMFWFQHFWFFNVMFLLFRNKSHISFRWAILVTQLLNCSHCSEIISIHHKATTPRVRPFFFRILIGVFNLRIVFLCRCVLNILLEFLLVAEIAIIRTIGGYLQL